MNYLYRKNKDKDKYLYIKDTMKNREIIESKIGKPSFVFDNFSYITVNVDKKEWRTSMDYEWLYCEKPELASIDSILEI